MKSCYMIKKVLLGYFILLSGLLLAQEKTIKDIEFVGLKKLKTTFIKKVISTKKGAILDTILLKEDLVLLNRMPAVRNAYFTIFENSNSYNVTIAIVENQTILPEFNAWTTTNKQFAYKLGIYDYNFLGKNISFGGFFQKNIFNSYGVHFKAPQLFSKKWGASINYLNWKSEEPLYFENNTANYSYQNTSLEFLAIHQLHLKHQLNFGITFFREKYQYLSGEIAADIPRKLNLNKVLFKGVYVFDNLTYYNHYISGFKTSLQTQFVTTENNYQHHFLIAWNDFFYFKRIASTANWANRLRFGLASNSNTPFAPFALDNNINIRGVGVLIDRGTGTFVLNSEYRQTLYDQNKIAIQSNFFVDLGSWRKPGGALSDFIKSQNIHLYSGVGLRFISKKIYNATFRIDYGFRLNNLQNNTKGGFVFGIGQYF